MTPEEIERMAINIMFSLDLNTCICDCLGCKTIHCSECELDKFPPYERNQLCCQNDLTGLVQALLTVQKQTREDVAKLFDERSPELANAIRESGEK